MKFLRVAIGSVLLLLFGFHATGQEMLGLVHGNYSGSNGISINPSNIANSKLRGDFNLFTFHSFTENNYFYLPAKEANIFNIVSGSYRFPYFPKPYGEGERNVYSYYKDPADKNIYINTRLNGPGAMFGWNGHMFALHSSFRVISSTRDLPHDIANFSYYTLDFYPQHNIYYDRGNFGMASMAFWEIGATYATVVARSHRSHWSAGITVNWMGGYSGAYLEGNQADYIAYNDSILNVDYLDGEMGFSLPIDYQTDRVDYTERLIRGSGMGIDIGITYQYRNKPYLKGNNRNYRKKFEDYRYKVGLAILDLGAVTFRNNAEKHVFQGVFNHHINVDLLEYDNIRDEVNAASELFYGDPDASLKGNRFRIYLPTSASIQMDYHPLGPWYLNGTFVMPLEIYKPMIKRPVTLAVTPRYETAWLEVSLPLVLYNFNHPRLGLSIRFYGLTIGSDNLGGFMGYNDLTGYDVYINYKINLTGEKRHYRSRKDPCWFN